ncbi:MAG: hypothetical protein AUG94_00895 [Actinobacteria bacterium 13_1_20CM_4_66_15]|nr:MAG: hypothetical protein AUG94_00895 [Actinobacteria bacterium 13_1_20CM_4_66_15]
MATTLVDVGRPVPSHAVELRPVRLAELGQLVGPVAHALLPLTRLQAFGMLLQALEDFVDAAHAAQVGGEARQPVVDDVRMRVVEARQDGRAAQVDHAGAWTSEAHDLAAAGGEDLAAGDRQVALGVETSASQRADAPARQDQFRSHSVVRLSGWR